MALPPSLPLLRFDAIVSVLPLLLLSWAALSARLTESPGPLMIDEPQSGTATSSGVDACRRPAGR
jgi:hypothetical protein